MISKAAACRHSERGLFSNPDESESEGEGRGDENCVLASEHESEAKEKCFYAVSILSWCALAICGFPNCWRILSYFILKSSSDQSNIRKLPLSIKQSFRSELSILPHCWNQWNPIFVSLSLDVHMPLQPSYSDVFLNESNVGSCCECSSSFVHDVPYHLTTSCWNERTIAWHMCERRESPFWRLGLVVFYSIHLLILRGKLSTLPSLLATSNYSSALDENDPQNPVFTLLLYYTKPVGQASSFHPWTVQPDEHISKRWKLRNSPSIIPNISENVFWQLLTEAFQKA